jgi:hypothetical protein
MKKTDNGYEIAFPILKPTDLESFVWVSRDVPAAALALLKNYTDPTKQINGKTYPIVNTTISGTKLAELAGKGVASSESRVLCQLTTCSSGCRGHFHHAPADGIAADG